MFLIYLSGDRNMNKKFNNGLAVILPNKKINLFVFFVLMLGIISGSIFLIAINESDKQLVVNQISNFISNVNNNNINNFFAFKNSLFENVIFIFIIWIFGLSIIGIIFNIFIMYLKGFIFGFTLTAFFFVFKFKGFLLGFIYMVPSMIINVAVTLIIGVYSIVLTTYLWKIIFMKDRGSNIISFLKKYLIILFFSLILIFISSLCEGYLVPAVIKLFIKLFI